MDWKDQHQPRFDAVTNRIHNSIDDILEVGVEPYDFTEEIVNTGTDATLHGIALGDGGEFTKTINGKEIAIKACNAETDRWPYEDNSMDWVVMGEILEHFLDPKAALKEARRVCRWGGKVVLTTPNAVRLHTRVKTLLGTNPFDGFAFESVYHRHNHEWTETELRDFLDTVGFKFIQVKCVTLNREGRVGSLFQWVTSKRRKWDDQYVIFCTPGEPREAEPNVYRESVVDRRSDNSGEKH